MSRHGDPALVAAALGDAPRANCMSQLAQAAGLAQREPLQGALDRKPRVRNRAESDACARAQT